MYVNLCHCERVFLHTLSHTYTRLFVSNCTNMYLSVYPRLLLCKLCVPSVSRRGEGLLVCLGLVTFFSKCDVNFTTDPWSRIARSICYQLIYLTYVSRVEKRGRSFGSHSPPPSTLYSHSKQNEMRYLIPFRAVVFPPIEINP